MTYLWMLIGFMILTGIAALFVYTLKLSAGEGMLLSACTVMLCMLAGLSAGSARAGAIAAGVIAAAGTVVAVVSHLHASVINRGGSMSVSEEDSLPSAQRSAESFSGRKTAPSLLIRQPVWIILFLLLILALISFFHDFIQRVDEFHTWAAVVKYMVEYSRLPVGSDFTGVSPRNCFATSLYIAFFQTLTGYSEPHMYAASFILIWTGWLLPFSAFKRNEWKKPLIYTLILYFGAYSLYTYGLKTLYVDVHTAAWAGGLAGWWINRRHKKTDFLTALCGLITVACMKPFAGPLMAVAVAVFMAGYALLVEKRILEKRNAEKIFFITLSAIVLISCILTAGLMLLSLRGSGMVPSFLMEGFTGNDGSKGKILRTFSAFVSGMTGRPLASKSNLRLSLLIVLAGVLLLLKASADLYRQRLAQLFTGAYAVFMSAGYLLVLFLAFIYMFSYEESVKTSGIARYFSMPAIYMLTIALTLLLQQRKSEHPRIKRYLILGVLAIFLYGLNTSFLSQYTGWDRWHVAGYEDILGSKKQAMKIQTLLESDDRVYFLNQSEKNEYPQNAALYYLENQVSDYNVTAWKMTEEGSITRLKENDWPAVKDLPSVFADGGYTYLWIYTTDDYLTDALPEVFEGAEDVKNGQLYRIIYGDDGIVEQLELCDDF